MSADYAGRDVVYLAGQNDTCNEDLTPKCQSHGLDKSCSGMPSQPAAPPFRSLCRANGAIDESDAHSCNQRCFEEADFHAECCGVAAGL